MRVSSAAALTLLALVAGARTAPARVLVTVDEALALAFPGAAIERGTVYLTPEELTRAGQLAGTQPATAIVHPYVAKRDGELVGTAYFDVHVVRTLSETVMVTVDPQGGVGRVEVLSFDEPPEYRPRVEWYRQFDGRRLDPELELRRSIHPVTGASLTARATTDAVRRVLALHQVLAERQRTAADAPAAARP